MEVEKKKSEAYLASFFRAHGATSSPSVTQRVAPFVLLAIRDVFRDRT